MILVTGSEGYVGAALCQKLKAEGYEGGKFDMVLGDDITNRDQVRGAAASADVIVHMAAVVGYPACERDPDMAGRVNVGGTANVVSCGKPIIYTSPMASFSGDVVTEDMEIEPSSIHAATKRDAERIIRESERHIILRLGSNYGVSPRMRDDLLVHTINI